MQLHWKQTVKNVYKQNIERMRWVGGEKVGGAGAKVAQKVKV